MFLPGSPAQAVGLRPRDIITGVDGASISALPYYNAMMYLHDPAVPLAVTVLLAGVDARLPGPGSCRGHDRFYNLTSIDPRDSLISELGIFGNNFRVPRSRLGSDCGPTRESTWWRPPSVVTVMPQAWPSGDVITSLNGIAILDIQGLRKAVREVIGPQARSLASRAAPQLC